MGQATITLNIAGTPEPEPDYTVSEPQSRNDANIRGSGTNVPAYFVGNYVNLSSTGHEQSVSATITGDNCTVNSHEWKVGTTVVAEPVTLAANETAQLFVDVTMPTTGPTDETATITVDSTWTAV